MKTLPLLISLLVVCSGSPLTIEVSQTSTSSIRDEAGDSSGTLVFTPINTSIIIDQNNKAINGSVENSDGVIEEIRDVQTFDDLIRLSQDISTIDTYLIQFGIKQPDINALDPATALEVEMALRRSLIPVPQNRSDDYILDDDVEVDI